IFWPSCESKKSETLRVRFLYRFNREIADQSSKLFSSARLGNHHMSEKDWVLSRDSNAKHSGSGGDPPMAADEFETPAIAPLLSVNDLFPPEIVKFGMDAGTVISVFSSAKSAVDVTAAVLKVLGILQDTNVEELFKQLNRHLDDAIGGLSWQVDKLAQGDRLG